MVLLLPALAAADTASAVAVAREKLVAAHGQAQAARIETGLQQAASLWRAEDGADADFVRFAEENFIADPAELKAAFLRLDKTFETLDGAAVEMGRDLKWGMDVDQGPMLKVDYLLAAYDPLAHMSDDLFQNKLAFFVLLNYEAPTLAQLAERGPGMDRLAWAQARLANRFRTRLPAAVIQSVVRAYVQAEDYISNYNVYLGDVLDQTGKALYPKDFGKLISHWGIRDELKAQYKNPDGLARQELIYQTMLSIVEQRIPREAVDNPGFAWSPYAGLPAGSKGPEPDTRYAVFLNLFQALRQADPYTPQYPTHIARKFDREREVPEARAEALLTSVCTSPLRHRVAAFLQKKLGRPLRPFDLYYNTLKAAPAVPEAELDALVAARYRSVGDFEKGIPDILRKLGFSDADAAFIGAHIKVDPARGSGHAQGAQRPEDSAHLRTRVPAGGMNYKGFNIAMHELGHNVEQVISNSMIDYHAMNGVPNTAFTEAFAFLFQGRDLEILGLTAADPKAEALDALNEFWMTYEIAGVALMDMKVWHWLYDHPDATPAQLKEAVIRIAKEVWNAYYADVFRVKDTPLLAIYSHMIHSALYLPDYPIGHIIAFQLKEYMEGKVLGAEMPRICRQGVLIPDLWMQGAVGDKLSSEPLLKATEEALGKLK
jgi:hypothetical protein